MKVASTLLALPVLFAAPLALAQDVPADAPPADEVPVETAPVEAAPIEATSAPIETSSPVEAAVAERGIQINGFVSGAYSYNINAPAGGGNLLRGNDTVDQSFEVDQAEVVFQLAPTEGNFGFRIDIANPGLGGTVFQNAIGSYVSKSGLRFDFGKFMTHIGYEVVDGYDGFNDHYTRGLLFQQTIPVYHIGAKVSKAFTDKISGTLLLVNGWENAAGTDVDNNDTPSLGFQVAIAATPMVSIYVNYLGGSEGPSDEPTFDFLRNTVNAVVVAKPSDKMTFALDATYTNQALGDADAVGWYGVAAFAKINLAPSFDLGVRAEFIGDPDGVKFSPALGEELTAYSVTLTPAYTIVPGYVVRGDLRLDGASEDIFPTDDEPSGTQVTLAANAIASF